MTTNIQGTRPSSRPSDDPITLTTPNGPVVATTGVSGVAVYERDGDVSPDPALHSSVSMIDDRPPVETRSTGSILTWIISAVVLILLVYFLLQWVF
jgi:hypothetical protein